MLLAIFTPAAIAPCARPTRTTARRRSYFLGIRTAERCFCEDMAGAVNSLLLARLEKRTCGE